MSRVARFSGWLNLLAALVASVARTTASSAQSDTGFRSDDAGGHAPRFLIAAAVPSSPAVRATPARVPVLRRRLTLALERATINESLDAIARQSGLRLMYSDAVIPRQWVINLKADDITVAAALTEVLLDTDVDVMFEKDGRAMLVRRSNPSSATVQYGTVAGRVTDSTTGHGIVNAEVFLDGTRWKAQTDSAGRYRLTEVEAGTYTLTARRFGYTKRSRSVSVQADQEATADLILPAAAARLDELVTTATGRQRRGNVPNDIATINVDSVMRAAPIHSVTDLLEHRVPGLMVQRTSGAPGDPARLRLRGAASPLQNNDPIVIVDGVRINAQQSSPRSANLAASGFAAPSPLDYIDPNSIETIEVVKGPSAATLYGQDAANGVIVITTKKGKPGPARWTAVAEHGRAQMAERYPDLLFRWGHGPNVQAPMYCPITGLSSDNFVTPCDGDSVRSFQILNDPTLTVLDKGHNTGLSLGVSGGTQALTYSVNGGFRDALGLIRLPDYEADRYRAVEGMDPPDWMRRPQRLRQWNATSTILAHLGSKADVALTTTLSRTKQQRSDLEQQLGTLLSTYLDRSSGVYYSNGGTGYTAAPTTFNLTQYRSQVTDAATGFTNSLQANWHPRSWLTVDARAGLDVQQRADQLFLPTRRDTVVVSSSVGEFNFGDGTTLTSTLHAGANAVAPLGHGLHFQFASGVDYAGHSYNSTALFTSGIPYGQRQAGSQVVGGGPGYVSEDDATFGWYMAPSITHPRFSVDLGLRLDGGSAYGSKVNGFKLPAFPKLGFSYLLSDEPFFPLKDLFQSFRVRAAYGRASRQPGAADRLRLYGTIRQELIDTLREDVVDLQTLGNTELKPERTAELEGGFDADLLDNRLNVTFTGYRKTTEDALLDVPLPPSVYGANVSVMRNIGVIRNTGLNLSADAQLLRSGGMTWSTRVTLTRNRSKVVRLGPGMLPFYTDPSFSNVPGGTRVAAGYPLFGRWSQPILGYADINGDHILETSEIQYGDTAVYVGQQEPDYEATLDPSVSLWHGALVVTAGIAHTGGLAQLNTLGDRLAPFSRGASDTTASLAEQLATGLAAVGATDFNWIQTVSTTRFNSLSVRYTVPVSMARHLGAQNLSIAVQGSNLGLSTNYRGLDPNVNAFITGNSVKDTGVLPMPRTWQVQINANY